MLQFFHLQSIVTYLLVDAVLLMCIMRNGHGKKLESDKVSYLAVVLLLRIKDPVSLMCHCPAMKSAGCVTSIFSARFV